MKKTILVLMLLLSLLALAACGKTADSNANAQASAAPTEAAAPAEATEPPAESPAADAAAKSWDISVQDADGMGVAGVTVQVCSDKTCVLVTTDSSGAAPFDGTEASYELHILAVPDGYASFDGTVTAKKGEPCVITLEKAESSTAAEAAAETTASSDADSSAEKLVFTTVDLDGNTVDESIFAQAKVTLVNIWEPWCSPCRREMPDLETLYQEYKDQGFQIIGVYSYEDNLQTVLEETGVTYPILKSTDVFANIIQKTYGYPTTFFVDSEGNILTETDEDLQIPINAYVDYYRRNVEAYVNGDYDEYKSDPQYADTLAQLEEWANDEDKMIEYASSEYLYSYVPNYYTLSMGYDSWKQLIENQLAKVN